MSATALVGGAKAERGGVSKRIDILGCDFDSTTTDEVVETALELIRSGGRGNLCTINVGSMMGLRTNRELREFVDGSTFATPDGVPLIWASKLLGKPLRERVTGTDTMEVLNGRAEEDGFGIYLLGGTADSLAGTVRYLNDRYPGLEICGAADGYFSDAEAPERAKAIAESGARILYVGMGVPRQELFLKRFWSDLGEIGFAIGVGGSFEVLSGKKKRAPELVQRAGMEWFFRLAQEPRRLWKRYLVGNSHFLYLLARELVRPKRYGAADGRT
jgi:N-acetylglucosaminyldiphosphoundecaprenol N-acetyl-beta-D-mannosaminyltransferase